MAHLSIKDTKLADETLRQIPVSSDRLPRSNSDLDNTINNSFIICALVIFAFNVVATAIGLITIGTKGYDSYIHASCMFISLLTLGGLVSVYKFIINR